MIATLSGSSDDETICALWQQLEKRNDATPFHQLSYLDSVARHYSNARVEVLVEHEGDIPLAGAALLVRKRGPILSEVFLPAYTPYSALFGSQSDNPDEAAELLSRLLAAVATNAQLVRIHLPPTVSAAFPPAGWEVSKLKTYVRRPTGLSDPTAGWSNNPTRNFRKYGDKYHVDEDSTAVDIAVRLNVGAYERRNRKTPLPPESIRELIIDRVGHGSASIHVATRIETGVAEAAIVLLQKGVRAYYWIVGSVPGPAMTVLIGRVMEYCEAEGISEFDFVGANTPGIADFKRRFGPGLVEYDALVRVSGWPLRLAKRVKLALRR